jgi:hypothetical protein
MSAKFLLVGSAALRHWYPERRRPKDFDFFTTLREFDRWANEYEHCIYNIAPEEDGQEHKRVVLLSVGIQLEFELALDDASSTRWFLKNAESQTTIDLFGLMATIASPFELLMIKRSHLHRPYQWPKHIDDYHFLCKRKLTLGAPLLKVVARRAAERDARDQQRPRVSLAMDNAAFFTQSDGVLRRHFAHDDLHEVVSYHGTPMYMKIKHDQSKAAVDRKLFDALPIAHKYQVVREEAYAIALERAIIPHWLMQHAMADAGLIGAHEVSIPSELIGRAYDYALMRICTTLTSGWFRDFAIDQHYHLRQPDVDYVKKFLTAVAHGRLRPLKKPQDLELESA